jgi:hypothetical protein
VKSPDAIVFPLIRKQNVFEPFPDSLTLALVPHWNVNSPNLVDPNQPCTKIVKTETTFNEIGPLFDVVDSQWYPKSPKAALQFPHSPLRSLAIGKD